MQCSTFRMWKQVGFWLGARWHVLAVVSLALAAVLGQPVAASAGWVACPPPVYEISGSPRRGRPVASGLCWVVRLRAGWEYWQRTCHQMLVRSVLLAGLGLGSQWRWGVGLALLPVLEWLVAGLAVTWPWWGQQPEVRLVRWGLGWLRWASLLLLGSALLAQGLRAALGPGGRGASLPPVGWLVGGVVAQQGVTDTVSQPVVEVLSGAEGTWLRLQGEFYLPLPEGPIAQRWAILWLRQLEGPTARRGSRATRDERRPLIPQQQLAACFGVPQPSISRWEGYWLAQDWANLWSLQTPLVLTAELRAQIVAVCARFPWWSQDQVWQHLQEQGVAVTRSQVRQAAQDSGWAHLQATLRRFWVVSAESLRPRDEALVTELLAQGQVLLTKLEAGAALPLENRLDIAHLHTLGTELGLQPPPAPTAVPWAQKAYWVLFGAEAVEEEGVIRCTYCGSSEVRPKGRQPRQKRYRDAAGQWQTVDVYRYRCDHLDCPYGSFTHFPGGLVPYSPYRLELRLSVLQMYAWGRSSYRRTGQAFGLRAGRAYQWVSAWGQELLPVAALFGVVKSSGVVGIDEKWVQVPEKAPRGSGRTRPPQPRRWMYVYLAVDVYTYDLLHIAIYACDSAASTRAFLLALRAKGYHPTVIVTDLRQEYGPAIQAIFPQARHHECIFHALQWSHRQLKEVYGYDYPATHPEAVVLKEQLDALFQVKTRRTAEKRYAQVMAWREEYVAQQPAAAGIFATLERHWPTLVNGIESTIIPRTNNAVELVIRRFDQHYQNFCGFESLETARLVLGVFEKVYRFTPFTDDAQPRIRGKCPLELAGYDIAKLPMTHICRGWALDWPTGSAQEVVPNA